MRFLRFSAKASEWVLGAALLGAALAVGTVHTSTLCIVTLALGAATALGWWGTEPANVRAPATVLLVTGAGLTAYTALQCIPLPMFVLAQIAPYNAAVWSRALFPLGEPSPSWAPLSLDPIATRVEVLKGTAYLLAFVASLRIARRRHGVTFLSAVLVLTGIVLAFAALLHPAFGAHKLYGFWEPASLSERHLAPFLNPNNLASYLNVSLCLALGMALSPVPRVPRLVSGSAVVVLGATQVWVASRGGTAAMVLGAGVVLAISRFGKAGPGRSFATGALLAAVMGGAGLILIVLGASEGASNELFAGDVSKLRLLSEAVHMLPRVPLFGVGRGAFETTFPAFRRSVGHLTYVHPENVVIEWALGWGAPIALVGLSGIAFGLRPHAVLVRSNSAAGAWAAIVAVTVQNFVDLGSEVPGLMLAAVVCAAMVVGGSAGLHPHWKVQEWATSPRAVATAGLALALAATAWAAPASGLSVDADRRELQHAALEEHAPRGEMHGLARAAMTRHPGEPYIPFAVALRASHLKDDSPIPWIGAALERSPLYGPAHLVLARVVSNRSPSQARLEYRMAVEQAPELAGLVLQEAPRLIGNYYDALEIIPPGRSGLLVLGALVKLLEPRLPSTSFRLNADHLGASQDEPAAWLVRARASVEDLEAGPSAPWCEAAARPQCVTRALAEAAHAELLAPRACEPYGLRARAEIASGNGMGALRVLTDVVDSVNDRVDCMELLVELSYRVNDSRRAEETLGRIINAGCSQDDDCAKNLAWIASTAEQHGNPQRALLLFKRAYERAPDQDGFLATIARLAASSGLHAEAADSYDRLARKHPEEPRWHAAAQTERSAALRESINL